MKILIALFVAYSVYKEPTLATPISIGILWLFMLAILDNND